MSRRRDDEAEEDDAVVDEAGVDEADDAPEGDLAEAASDDDSITERSGAVSGLLGATVPAGFFLVAVLVAAALAVLSVVALSGGGDGTADDDGARRAASDYATRFLALDFADLESWRSELTSVGTPSFVDEIESRAETLGAIAEQTQTRWQGSVIDVYLGVADGPNRTAVIRYDLTVDDTQGTRQLSDHYLRVDMVRTGEEWLIDSIVTLTLGASAVDGDAPLSPSTTAPQSTSEPTESSPTTTG